MSCTGQPGAGVMPLELLCMHVTLELCVERSLEPGGQAAQHGIFSRTEVGPALSAACKEGNTVMVPIA